MTTPGRLPPLSDAATATVSVERIDSAPSGLVRVRVRLADGTVRTIVIPSSSASVGNVAFSALALAQLALQGKVGA